VLGTEVSFDTGQRLAIDAAWLAGNASDPGSSVRWFEVGLSALQEFELSGAITLAAGGQAAIASVRLGPVVGDGPSADGLHTWSARAGALARVEFSLSRAVALGLGPEVGVLLHPVVGKGEDGQATHLRGAWLGAGVTLSAVIDP
jgi:hypothetical protein